MQHDQPGERTWGKEQVVPLARRRAGARAAMRATNRYTMPPLTPRGQHHVDLFWNAQSQDGEMASVSYQPTQPLSAAEEDAWLNDVLPPSYLVRSSGDTGTQARLDRGARTNEEVRATEKVRASEGARAT